MSKEFDRVQCVDRLNALANAGHHATRVLENLIALKKLLPAKAYDDLHRDIDQQVAMAQQTAHMIAGDISTHAQHLVAHLK